MSRLNFCNRRFGLDNDVCVIMWLHDLLGCNALSHRLASLQTPGVANALAALVAPLSDFHPDAMTSGGSRAKLGIFKPQWRAKIGYLGRLAIDRKFHCLKLHLHHYALLQSTEKVIPNAEAHHRARATDHWQEQDNWCTPLFAQIINTDTVTQGNLEKKIEEVNKVSLVKNLIPKPLGQAGWKNGYSLFKEVQLPQDCYAQISVCLWDYCMCTPILSLLLASK